MPTTKIGEYIDKTCRHPDHSPKMENVQTPGIYRHVCPQCELEIEFTNVHPKMTKDIWSMMICSPTVKYTGGKPWPWT